MSGRCEECGEDTVWESDLGSAICTHCGTLADPTQSVLTSHLEPTENSTRDLHWTTLPGGTLKGRNGWALSGQGKEARDRANTIVMHEFIRSLAARLCSPGTAVRAQGLFDQAMRRGQFRWGRKAKLVAGAAISIAFRESRKSDSISDIAYVLDEPSVAVSRTLTSIVALLQLRLISADPSVHLPTLRAHLLSLAQDASSTLPVKLRTVLNQLIPRIPTVMQISSSLSTLVSRTNILSNVPSPPTACAILMLSLEGELLSSLPHAGALAQTLGARFSISKGTVMHRYKAIYDLLENWIREVPWLEAHERKKGGTGRSKIAKRVVVSRGLKDVVQFQEEIWRKKLDGQTRLHLELEIDENEATDDERERDGDASRGVLHVLEGNDAGTLLRSLPVAKQDDVILSAPPRKKRKTVHERSVATASQFLLNSGSTGPTCSSSRASDGDTSDLLTHLLTADAFNLSHAFSRAPTRLQMLATSRGGAEEFNIPDEELFDEGELENLFRTDEEVAILRTTMDWDDDEEVDATSSDDGPRARKRKRSKQNNEECEAFAQSKPGGTKRINMDALQKLLDPSYNINEETDESENSDSEGAQYGDAPVGNDGEIVEEWRPLSPGGHGFDEDRYDV
ncbi:uncharacterized protein FIBRA_05833 [Fibroporia radiculosa]|uniref:TFIIB-type domain-containing protein n=1 Tax=Fibroporia radiculosa TaxID=599839 RepID=J4H3R2_9APHY|nr:uncharacterized protein FIBRA_05833 [Fibroporia radiculosa]CCM03689.1 predicted protein [Fibroporia radiculosa]